MGSSLAAACRPAAGGACLEVEVVPGASAPGFPTGFNRWRRRVQARLAAPPEDGAANRELVERAARALAVAPGDVEIVAGRTTRRKTLLVRGLTVETLQARLAAAGVDA